MASIHTTKDQNYIAKFSTGIIRRKSNHVYKTAAAYVNKETGEIKNVTFSQNVAKASATGLFSHKSPERCWFKSREKWLKAIEENEMEQRRWKMEVVEVEIEE